MKLRASENFDAEFSGLTSSAPLPYTILAGQVYLGARL